MKMNYEQALEIAKTLPPVSRDKFEKQVIELLQSFVEAEKDIYIRIKHEDRFYCYDSVRKISDLEDEIL